ncbi:MAG: glycogen/starch/alpha-glucan phosphorylase [bacterium]|nr:glycogen/starch/alpha-glucan phosphorylase [bacterium]
MDNGKLKVIEDFQYQLERLGVFEHEVTDILHHIVGKRLNECNNDDRYKLISFAMRSNILDNWFNTEEKIKKNNRKKIYYLSLEFLIGRVLQNNSISLNQEHLASSLIEMLGINIEEIYEEENDAGLGNGGLGRLAACFLDSMATMKIPGFGFGIRYEYGIFKQIIQNGWQVEKPDKWLKNGYPWEIKRLDKSVNIKFYGEVLHTYDSKNKLKVKWINTQDIIAVPYDVLISGYRNTTTNLLTLWSASSTDEFNLDFFNSGDYEKAVKNKANDEVISKVLYPNDSLSSGKELRLKQQYFFVSASLQTIISEHIKCKNSILNLQDKAAIQLNDTHPSIAIPELMRILLDEYKLEWKDAWNISTNTFAYTNHTLLPEALEKWSIELLGKVLPRHMEIIYEINSRFLDSVREKYPNDNEIISRMSLIEESTPKQVRMAYLAIVGSHSVNGVAKLHTELLKSKLLPDFYKVFPEKFNNKTNGITQRRWLKVCNPNLSGLISDTIGDEWITDLTKLKQLENFIDDKYFRYSWNAIKYNNKVKFSEYCKRTYNFDFSPDSMYDSQFKRIHEYKRQLLKVFHVIHRYFELKNKVNNISNLTDLNETPRTILIGGKAAPAYTMAKLIIKLINDVSSVINNDGETNPFLKMYFIPNYSVSLAEKIIPATELSEQISTAGTEASGTGNMKFALNGALTVGTLDGANIEILDEVGKDNIFIFGMNTDEVVNLKNAGYTPYNYYETNIALKKVVDSIQHGHFSPEDPSRFSSLIESLFSIDQYMLFADFQSYVDCQSEIDNEYKNSDLWTKKSILNTANMGYFSSDRTISEYAREIWGVSTISK